MSEPVNPFVIKVPEEDLAFLQGRLAKTRWPEPEPVDDWSQGIPLAYTQEICAYWAKGYDWRPTEAKLNSFGSFHTSINDLGIWFLHTRSPNKDALPLVITHGWPGSVWEFHKVIGPLTDPAAYGGDPDDAFHVVCPSLPGFGFSDKPTAPGWGLERIAEAWTKLMIRLGYEQFVAQGGDWGAMVTTLLGARHGDHVQGVHLNMPLTIPTGENPTEEEVAALASIDNYLNKGSGYSKIQATRPQTVGYGLVDSPAGQCAWVVEKFREWTDCDGHPENVLTRDEILDNVMLYWLPGDGASSARLYWESFDSPPFDAVDVPVACSIFPKEIFRTSRRWAEARFPDLRYFNQPPKGGHFAAFEQPDLFVDELRAAFRTMR